MTAETFDDESRPGGEDAAMSSGGKPKRKFGLPKGTMKRRNGGAPMTAETFDDESRPGGEDAAMSSGGKPKRKFGLPKGTMKRRNGGTKRGGNDESSDDE